MHTIRQNKCFSRRVAQREPPKIPLCGNKSIIPLRCFQAYILQELGPAGTAQQSPRFGRGRSSGGGGEGGLGGRGWAGGTPRAPVPHGQAAPQPPRVAGNEVPSFLWPAKPFLTLWGHFAATNRPVLALPLGESQAGWQQPPQTDCPCAQTRARPCPQPCLSFPLSPKMWGELWQLCQSSSPPRGQGQVTLRWVTGWTRVCRQCLQQVNISC